MTLHSHDYRRFFRTCLDKREDALSPSKISSFPWSGRVICCCCFTSFVAPIFAFRLIYFLTLSPVTVLESCCRSLINLGLLSFGRVNDDGESEISASEKFLRATDLQGERWLIEQKETPSRGNFGGIRKSNPLSISLECEKENNFSTTKSFQNYCE